MALMPWRARSERCSFAMTESGQNKALPHACLLVRKLGNFARLEELARHTSIAVIGRARNPCSRPREVSGPSHRGNGGVGPWSARRWANRNGARPLGSRKSG